MLSPSAVKTQVERVDDLPLLFGLLQKMRLQETADSIIMPHGNWQGLNLGWVMTIWLIHVLSEHNHSMEAVQEWVGRHLVTLQRLTGQPVRALDFTDDRLALCLRYLAKAETWEAMESVLGERLLRVYGLKERPGVMRLDAMTGTVGHDAEQHTLFKVGKAKNGLYETQFKMMLASLDPLGLPLAVDVVPGNKADDPLYVPSYRRAKKIVGRNGLLVVGDSKMSALKTRAAIVDGDDYYLTPRSYLKDEPDLLSELLIPWQGREEEADLIFFAEDLPDDGSEPDPELAIARGFELRRQQTVELDGKTITWEERLLVVRSFSYVKTMQAGFHRRLDKAERALQALTPPRQRGKHQIEDEASLLAAIKRIEKHYKVQGCFHYDYEQQVSEKQVRAYKDKPTRTERKVRLQLTVTRNQKAIAAAEFEAGWRIYATNAPSFELTLSQAVWAYRDQYLAENIFRRLQGKILSITPVYVQRDDHARGLFHFLTIGARLLALGDYVARQKLAAEGAELAGVYAGNAKRSTARPTTERMLRAFEGINLIKITIGEQTLLQLTELSPVQERILSLLDLPLSIYTDLVTQDSLQEETHQATLRQEPPANDQLTTMHRDLQLA